MLEYKKIVHYAGKQNWNGFPEHRFVKNFSALVECLRNLSAPEKPLSAHFVFNPSDLRYF